MRFGLSMRKLGTDAIAAGVRLKDVGIDGEALAFDPRPAPMQARTTASNT
jgi:hypothetical protein